MQIRFDMNMNDTDSIMVYVHNLIYVEMIGPVDYTKLVLLFMMMGLRMMHPSVHEALAPDLIDGSLTLPTLKQCLKQCLSYYHEL